MGKFVIEKHNGESIWRLYENEYGDIAGEEAYLTPYTEPDLEQVKKETYEKGYDDAKSGYDNGFENGMIVAWEAARKIIHMPEGDLLNIFTECYSAVCTALQVILKYDAAEAIEKLKAYEQEQNEIQVGDEVTAEQGGSTFTVTWMSDICICGIDSDGRCYSYEVDEVDGKTGNHHDIATLLEKMREGQDE